MSNIYKYYENTKNAKPNKNIREFMELKHENGNAIELGCGAGRDTKFLLENKWNVLAIDKEDVSKIIKEKLNIEELKRFKFQKQELENLQLEKTNLIVANYSLPFCKKEKWVLCPICNSKTRIKVRPDTVLENFPLFCPKCKQETIINVRQFNTSVITEPDAETQSR